MQFPKFLGIERHKFVLTIGEEGAILCYFKGNTLSQRLFATWGIAEEKNAFEKLLASDPKAPIYLMVDLLELSCTSQSLPAVSSFSINKLVRRRLERDFAHHDIKGAIFVGREKKGRKDWNYLFVSARIAPPLSDWLDFVLQQKNTLAGIAALPLEGQWLTKLFHVPKKHWFHKPDLLAMPVQPQKPSEWQCIVLHNKVSGFRQIILHHGKLVFTRLVRSSEHDLPGVVAGNIEQEVINTLEYLRRLSFQDGQGIDILICVSNEIKSHFEIKAIRGHPFTVVTPFELAGKLHLPATGYQNDRYVDAVFSAIFAKHRPVLPLHSPLTQRLAQFSLASAWAKAIAVALVPILAFYFTYSYIETTRLREIISFAKERKDNLERIWTSKQEQARQTQPDNVSKINDMVSLYRLLSEGGENPLSIISKFNAVKGNNALVASIEWQLLESEASKQRQKKPTISVLFNVELYNKGDSFEEVFDTFDGFIHRIEDNFKGYKVEYTELPEKLTLSQQSKVIPVQVRITGLGI